MNSLFSIIDEFVGYFLKEILIIFLFFYNFAFNSANFHMRVISVN